MAGSLTEQLGPVAERMRRNSPSLRQVVHIAADICGTDKTVAIAMARQQALTWVQRRVGQLPENAWKFEDFEYLMPGSSAVAITIKRDDVDYWVVRCDDPDKEVPGRTWTTEITVGYRGDHAGFGLRLMVAGRGELDGFIPSVPGVVRQVAARPGLLRGQRRISEEPNLVGSLEQMDGLLNLIEDKGRRRPVYVVSLNEGVVEPGMAAVDVYDLAKRCIGIAHVYVVPSHFTYEITNRLGKEFSVFWGAVRTYRPDFDVSSDSPFSHPRALPETIQNWNKQGAGAFVDFLVKGAAEESLARISTDADLPSFSKVKQAALALQRESATNQGADIAIQMEIANQIIKEKEKLVIEWEALALEEQDKRISAEELTKASESQIYWLRERNEALEQKILELSGVVSEVPIPTSYDELSNWANQYLPGKILLTGRAIRAAKGALFEDVGLVYKSLVLLANEYRDLKMGKGGEVFYEKLKGLNLECSASFAGERAGEFGDTYIVKYAGRNRELDMHLKWGNAREERRCLRIYFFWDEEKSVVVVGSLPAHLKTRAS